MKKIRRAQPRGPRDRPVVLFDATAIPANRGGVGRYVENVVAELVRLDVTLAVVCQPRDRTAFEAAGVRKVVTIASWGSRASGRFLWEQVALPGLARRLGATVIHSPHYTFPLVTARRRVVTIHDLTFFSAPEVHGRLKRVFFGTWIKAARVCRATVVTPSAATAEAYIAETHARPKTVFAAPLGYDAVVFHPPTVEEIAAFSASLNPRPATWIAFLGTLEPRKNVSALVRGYTDAVSALDAADRPALLLAGGPGWDDTVTVAVDAARAGGFDVRLLGYLPIEHLRALLGGSLITAYPSLGEGFGLPVLEAMACGSAVLTTDRLSLPEVGGDAVSYTEVDSASIATSLAALLADPSLRHSLAEKGIARASRFTWAACADEHLRAYRAALSA